MILFVLDMTRKKESQNPSSLLLTYGPKKIQSGRSAKPSPRHNPPSRAIGGGGGYSGTCHFLSFYQ